MEKSTFKAHVDFRGSVPLMACKATHILQKRPNFFGCPQTWRTVLNNLSWIANLSDYWFEFILQADIERTEHPCDPKMEKRAQRNLKKRKLSVSDTTADTSATADTSTAADTSTTADTNETGIDFGDADLDSSLVQAAKSFLLEDSDEDEIEFPRTPPGARRKSLSEFKKETPINAAKLAMKKSDSVKLSGGRKRKAQTSTPTAKRRKW